jgi:hypothetical protein
MSYSPWLILGASQNCIVIRNPQSFVLPTVVIAYKFSILPMGHLISEIHFSPYSLLQNQMSLQITVFHDM